MIHDLINRIKNILTHDGTFAEFQGALLEVTWGIWLILASPFDAYGNQVYVMLASQMPDDYWGVLFLVLGTTQCWALLYEIYVVRKACSFFAFSLWFYVFLMSLFSAPAVLLVPTSFCFSIAAVWSTIRLSKPKRCVKR